MTKIESLTTFRNQRHLSAHKGNRLRRGEVAEVPDRYAETVVERGLAVYADEDAEVTDETGAAGPKSGRASPPDSTADSAAAYAIGGHHAGGFYYLLYGGERTGETVGRGKDTADEIADELNDNGVDPDHLEDWLT